MAACAEIVGISPTEANDGRVGAGGNLDREDERALAGGALAGSEAGTAGERGVTGARAGGDGGRGGASAGGGSGAAGGGALLAGERAEPSSGGASAGDGGAPAPDLVPTGGGPAASGGKGGDAGELTGGGGASAGDGGAPAPDLVPTGGGPAASGGKGGDAGELTGGGGASAGTAGGEAGGADAGTGGTGDPERGGAGTSAGTAGGEAGGADAGTGGTAGGPPAACSEGGAATSCTPACPPDRPSCVDGQCVVRGPSLILVERLPASDSFYIDSTEVTVRQYLEFLAATNGEVGCQPRECAWNTSFAPAPGEVTSPSDLPMHHVDWCDARAYCAWAGKRLCGRVGGGVLPHTSADDFDLSEWLIACGGPGYSWHPSLDASGEPAVECNDWSSSYRPAGSTCEGSYPGLFDMEGNVSEWIDSCSDTSGAADTCATMGGNAVSNSSGDYCFTLGPLRRDDRYSFHGFRCCAPAG